ncbi:MAG: C1 family peptidase [Rikenellaceae bacterium]
MKKLFLAAALFLSLGASAQPRGAKGPEAGETEGYKFTDTKVIPGTSVKNQHRSGTCWCYSGISFLENEIIKSGGSELDLSEMWIVRSAYYDKAIKYARLHGHLNLAVGGAFHDVTEMIKKYGIVPQEVYQGLNYGTDLPVFGEIDSVIKGYMDAVIKNSNRTLTTAWKAGLNAILDSYFGAMPETFTFEGKEYTPQSYAASLPINIDDYITVSSFTHHPFYSEFVVEVPDNWMWMPSYNLPLDEMMEVIDSAIEAGHSIGWATDVSEQGFSRTKAVAIVPEDDLDNLSGTEAERWGAMTEAEKSKALYAFDGPIKEKTITQEMRQEAYDNYQSTDDHGMVIEGIAVDQAGNPFFKVKNSWAANPPYEGYYYFSRPFVEYKTISIMVNKNVLPKSIKASLGL